MLFQKKNSKFNSSDISLLEYKMYILKCFFYIYLKNSYLPEIISIFLKKCILGKHHVNNPK